MSSEPVGESVSRARASHTRRVPGLVPGTPSDRRAPRGLVPTCPTGPAAFPPVASVILENRPIAVPARTESTAAASASGIDSSLSRASPRARRRTPSSFRAHSAIIEDPAHMFESDPSLRIRSPQGPARDVRKSVPRPLGRRRPRAEGRRRERTPACAHALRPFATDHIPLREAARARARRPRPAPPTIVLSTKSRYTFQTIAKRRHRPAPTRSSARRHPQGVSFPTHPPKRQTSPVAPRTGCLREPQALNASCGFDGILAFLRMARVN